MSELSTAVHIDEGLANIINGAFENGKPIVVAYVDSDGQPHLSFRGSTQAFSEDQCAMWIRESEGGLLKSIGSNPRMTMMYRDSSTKTTYLLYGRARLESDPEVARKIYEQSPKAERDRDANMAGRAIVIDIDAIQGGTAENRVRMGQMAP